MEIKLTKETGDMLLDIENPLLLTYKEKAPGSFKHSEEVATVCDKIGRELKLDTNILYQYFTYSWFISRYRKNVVSGILL